MFTNIATKVALKKLGLPSNSLDFSWDSGDPPRQPNKLRKAPPSPKPHADHDDDDDGGGGWSSWISTKSLPLAVHPWLAPPPPPIQVAQLPQIGDNAALRDPQNKLQLGQGQRTLVVFLRCAGCAFAQKTFLNLRSLANRHHASLRCIAVSHASSQATRQWIDLLGGAWDVQVVIDEDRALYAAWGLGLANVWHLFNPATQAAGWKEKGWLGDEVASAMQRRGGRVQDEEGDGSTSVMGSKWQEAGAFAVDGQGTVIWGGKALSADDGMELEGGAKLLML